MTVNILDRDYSASQSEDHMVSPQGTCHKATVAESHGNVAGLGGSFVTVEQPSLS